MHALEHVEQLAYDWGGIARAVHWGRLDAWGTQGSMLRDALTILHHLVSSLVRILRHCKCARWCMKLQVAGSIAQLGSHGPTRLL